MGTEYNSNKTSLLTSETRQLCGEYRTTVTDCSSIDDAIIELTRNSDSTVVLVSQRAEKEKMSREVEQTWNMWLSKGASSHCGQKAKLIEP